MAINKKYIKYAGIAGGLFLLWKFLDNTKSNKDTAAQQDQENQDAQNSGIALSYPVSNYQVWADNLQAAMFDAGTDEDTIFDVFDKLNNIRDLLELVKAFGLRTYYYFGIPQGDYNLGQWFTEELSSGEKDQVNDILSSHNINYRF